MARPNGDGRAADEARERELLSQIDRACSDLTSAAERAVTSANALAAAAERGRGEAVAAARRALNQNLALASEHAELRGTAFADRAARLAARLAPGPAGASWDDRAWRADLPASPPQAIRAGVLKAAGGEGSAGGLPLLLPMLGDGNAILVTSAGDADAAAALCSALVLRLVASVPPGDMQIHWIDPRLRGALAPFAPLRKSQPPVLGPALTSEDQIADCLARLAADVSRVSELLAGRHESLRDLREQASQSDEPFRLLVVYDFPMAFSARTAAALARVMERGPRCGVFTIMHHDAGAPVPDQVDVTAFARLGETLRAESGKWTTSRPIGSFILVPDGPPPTDLVEEVSLRVAARAATESAPALPLADLITPREQWGSGSSAERLTVTLGRSGLDRIGFTLGDGLDQRHNVLVGGAVGQGKSNVLLVIIHSLAALYPPSELEFFLLDFKEGLEFARLAPGGTDLAWLPQARVLGLDSDRLFGLAVLRHLRREFDRRARLFKDAGASDVARFRVARPTEPMPRQVVVLDEFQVLIEGHDEITDEALALLDTLARKGRAYGIHLILASQTLSGIQALVTRENSIFSQFPLRIALKTSGSESQVLLQHGNTAAADLRYRGEAVFNTESGAPTANQRVTIARADEEFCANLRGELVRRYGGSRPTVFAGSEPADLLAALSGMTGQPDRSGQPRALLGTPVAVDQTPVRFTFNPEPGRHLILIGPGSEPDPPGAPGYEALATLQAACLSLAYLAPSGSVRFTLLDWMSPAQRDAARLSDLAMVISAFGQEASIFADDAAVAVVAGLAAETAADPARTTYLVGWGCHRAAGLEVADPISLSRPADGLVRIINHGPVAGVHLIGWWNSYKAYEQQIERDFGAAGLAHGFVFLRASQHDVSQVTGPLTEWYPAPNRFLMYDRAAAGGNVIGLPFRLLDTADLDRLARMPSLIRSEP